MVWAACVAVAGVAGAVTLPAAEHGGPPQPWSSFKVHDMSRPAPPVVTPGTASTPEQPGKPPSDAIVLFDGTNLPMAGWAEGDPAAWKIEDGV